MKSTIDKILMAGIILVMTGSLLADPVSPVGTGRDPVSSGRSPGLRRSPDPIDSSVNDVVTGNVSGDKYFRGNVPYRSTTNFGGNTSSTSLDDFLRRSSDSSVYDYNSGRYKPYYSPSGSVSLIRPGRSAVFSAPDVDFSGRVATGTATTDALPKIMNINPDHQLFSNQMRPIQLNSEETRKAIETDLNTRFKNLQTENVEADTEIQKIKPDPAKAKEQIDALRTELEEKQRQTVLNKLDSEEATKEPQPTTEPTETERLAAKVASGEQLDVYDQMRMEVVGLGEMLKVKQEIAKQESPTQEKSLEEAQKDPSPKEVVVEAKTYKTFATFKNDKFNKHLRLAEAYLKEGKYYQASNAYSLAEFYKPGDPVVYAGKSQALFAAGEFMSSAYYLSEAVRVFPGMVKIKIDLAALIGDKDVLESRASDVEELIKEFNSVELKYLLSYVYYQTDRLVRAKELIDDAYKTNPDLQIVQVIRSAIDEALNKTE